MTQSRGFFTLGIETSCDETSVAVLQDQTNLIANVVYSQAGIHAKYGGVVPEVASRNHVKKLPYLIDEAMGKSGLKLSDLSLIAATYGPGLVGPLLVGLSHGKAMAYGLEIPFIGVNHLEGHIFAHRLHEPEAEPPFMALVVSGGHTSLIQVRGYGDYQIVGATVDDAAGEALDKIGKMMGIGYPAGAEIDRLAAEGDPKAIPFPRPMLSSPGFDFSFSGLKTAVLYHLRKNPREANADVAASVLASVVDILARKSIEATRRYHMKRLVVVGGVAANRHLRERLISDGEERGVSVHFPPISLCTDNAAMIAAVGAYRFQAFSETHEMSLAPQPSLAVGDMTPNA